MQVLGGLLTLLAVLSCNAYTFIWKGIDKRFLMTAIYLYFWCLLRVVNQYRCCGGVGVMEIPLHLAQVNWLVET